MSPRSGPQNCPQCGAIAPGGQKFCGGCGQTLLFCTLCGATNLAWSSFCHNCGKMLTKAPATVTPLRTSPSDQSEKIDTIVLRYLESQRGEISVSNASRELGLPELELRKSLGRLSHKGVIVTEHPTPAPRIERMRLCDSCKKAIGGEEKFCSYCGRPQAPLEARPQPSLDPRTMKVALMMLEKITNAKQHPDYSAIDQLTTLIGEVALGKEKPQDAQELSFSDQIRLLTLVFEYSRDKVGYKGESFGEHVRWPWETIKTGGDCDCKVVLLATMLASLAFRRMHLLLLPAGTYVDTKQGADKRIQGHVILEAELTDKGRPVRVRMDPSCADCDVDEISESIRPLLANFYRIPIIP